MCLVVSEIHHLWYRGAMTAEEDIKVYKGLIPFSDHTFITPFVWKFIWAPNNTIIMEAVLDLPFVVIDPFTKEKLRIIEKGIHAYTEKEPEFYKNCGSEIGMYLFEAIIPKGASYYIGTKGEIVSNKLIIYTNKPVKID